MGIGDKIKKRLKALGINQAELGRRSGFTATAVSNWIGGRLPGRKSLERLADILETTTDYLLGKTNDPLRPGIRPDDDLIPSTHADIKEVLAAIKALGDRLVPKISNVLKFPSRPSLAGLLELPVGAGRVSIDQILERDATARIPVEAPEPVDFLIPVRGDSMSPLICDGALLFVRKIVPDQFVEGDIAICYHLEEGEWNCRQIFFHQKESGMMVGLKALKTGKTTWHTCDQVHCQGKVVKWENDPRKIKEILEGK